MCVLYHSAVLFAPNSNSSKGNALPSFFLGRCYYKLEYGLVNLSVNYLEELCILSICLAV